MIFGYLDPVTGSAIVQALLGALAVVGLGWQYMRRGARSLWSTLRGARGRDHIELQAELTESETETPAP
jgi:hypothetical protein